MHSHSGQFCPGHAKDGLEEVIQTAIARGMTTFGLTEHMPREEKDLYPEEVFKSLNSYISPKLNSPISRYQQASLLPRYFPDTKPTSSKPNVYEKNTKTKSRY